MSARRHGLPRTLAEDVRSELARLGGPGGKDLVELAAAWPACAGEAIAANAWPARFARDGTLVVHASSSTWAFELTQLEESIRSRLGTLAPQRLRFVVGPIPSPAAETGPVPSVQRSLHSATPADRARAEEIARAIEDPGLREAVARAAAASLAAAAEGAGTTGRSDRLRNG